MQVFSSGDTTFIETSKFLLFRILFILLAKFVKFCFFKMNFIYVVTYFIYILSACFWSVIGVYLWRSYLFYPIFHSALMLFTKKIRFTIKSYAVVLKSISV